MKWRYRLRRRADLEIRRVNLAAPEKARLGGYLLHSVEEEVRGPSASQLRDLQIMKHLRLTIGTVASSRPPDAAVIAPVLGGDPRLSSDRWWKVKQEQEQAAAKHAAREAKEQEAKTLGNYRTS
jgi:hypothetical protein